MHGIVIRQYLVNCYQNFPYPNFFNRLNAFNFKLETLANEIIENVYRCE